MILTVKMREFVGYTTGSNVSDWGKLGNLFYNLSQITHTPMLNVFAIF